MASTRTICTVDGCDREFLARGLCSKHYDQMRSKPDFVPRPRPIGCTVEGCQNPHKGLGFCSNHYWRWTQFGDPLSTVEQRRQDRLARKFDLVWQAYETDPTTGCWNWTGEIKSGVSGGYGQVSVNRRKVRAHRMFYEHFVGPIPDGLEMRHSCDNRRCVNPDHLLPGTHLQNIQDMVDRRRRKLNQCPKGHPYDSDRVMADGSRCLICRRDRSNRYARRVRAAAVVVLVLLASLAAVAPRTTLAQPSSSSASVALGSSGHRVLEVQYLLISHGYVGVVADGRFGPQTARAVAHYQRSNGLVVDSIAGPQTLASLGLVATASPPAVRTTPPPAPITPTEPVGDAESIIRDVWPDQLEDEAVRIATRESRLQPDVINRNGNATGLFQIMWTVHRGWLCPQLGVCAQSDLQDARTNAEAALALYERSAEASDGYGWGPWRLG